MRISCPVCESKVKVVGGSVHCKRCGYQGPSTKVDGLKATHECPKCGSPFYDKQVIGEKLICQMCGTKY
jgi:DNA-directed RNA polymerase subunit M/transcription elongation factor TFIIS